MNLHIGLEPVLLDQTNGVWCEVCEMPSAFRRSFAVCSSLTLAIYSRFALVACRSCGDVYREAVA